MTFELTNEMIAVVGQALENMPYKMSASVIAELQKQINAQQQKPEPAKLDEAA